MRFTHINMPLLTLNVKNRKSASPLALDMLQKEGLASIRGGNASANKVCGCVCVGPVTPIKVESGGISEVPASDSDRADCGATDACRTADKPVIQ